VAPADTLAALGAVADEVVCLEVPEGFSAVGQWYEDFTQTSDAEVERILDAAAAREPLARGVTIPVGAVDLAGELVVPVGAAGVVVFAHGSGSSRHSPRNRYVAEVLQDEGLATLLFDLLTPDEEVDRAHVFDVRLLGRRLVTVTEWLAHDPATRRLPVGYFGASTGAAAALWAAAEPGSGVRAVVARGGRPDLAGDRLGRVGAPTLLVVGGDDDTVLRLNRAAAAELRGEHRIEVVAGATHLFEEPGALEASARLAADWFLDHL
jgi:putative phosphoribosyl transferase